MSPLELSTPALLFPALSLLLLAYTNRFLTLANLIRTLHKELTDNAKPQIRRQITNLQRRIKLIQAMQILGVLSLLLCVVSMFFLFFRVELFGELMFALSLVSLAASLGFSLRELAISVRALNVQLSDLEDGCEEPD